MCVCVCMNVEGVNVLGVSPATGWPLVILFARWLTLICTARRSLPRETRPRREQGCVGAAAPLRALLRCGLMVFICLMKSCVGKLMEETRKL